MMPAGTTHTWNQTVQNINGTLFDSAGSPITSGRTIKLLQNGTSVGTTVTNGSGVYSFTGVTLASGDKIAVYISGALEKGATITLSGAADITNLNIRQNVLIVRTDSGGAITNANLREAEGGSPDPDLTAVRILDLANVLFVPPSFTLEIWTGSTYAPGADINDLGNWTNNGTFVPGIHTVKFNGISNQSIAGSSSTTFNNLTISNTGTSPDNVVSLDGSAGATNTIASKLTITSGVFDQGTDLASSSLIVSGTSRCVEVRPGATWRNRGRGDETLSCDVFNEGTIEFNAAGKSCGDDDEIQIRSSVTGTQRTWEGPGTFSMIDVDVQDQRVPGDVTLPLQILVNSGTNSTNNTGWTFLTTCVGPYTWIGGVGQRWADEVNWSPLRTDANNASTSDVLIFDGSVTPTAVVEDVQNQTNAAIRLQNGVLVTLKANVGGATLTMDGDTGTDLDVPAGTLLTFAGSRPLTIELTAPGHECEVAGRIIMQDEAHQLIGANAGEITMTGADAFTTTTGFNGHPFGTGTDGSVVFQSGSTGSFNAGLDPFGGIGNSVVTFNSGSTAHFRSATAFFGDGGTYGNLILDGVNQSYFQAGSNQTTILNNFTLGIGNTLVLSSTPGADMNLFGNFRDETVLSNAFQVNGRTVKFQGATQTIFKAAGIASFSDVSIAQAPGGKVQLLSPTDLAGQLNLSTANSLLELNGQVLELLGTVTGPGNLKGDPNAIIAANGGGDVGTVNFVSGGRNLSGLLLNRPNGSMTLGTDLAIGGTLRLDDGKLITANTLSLGPVSSVLRTNGYVIGNLQKSFGASGNLGSFTFPLGTANAYSPLDANVTANSNGTLTVKAVQGQQPNIPGTNALQRYWTLSGSGITADLTFHYSTSPTNDVVGNEANYKIFKYDGSFTQFTPDATGSNSASDHFATLNNVSSFSDWTLAEPSAVTPGNLQFSAPNYDDTEQNSSTHTATITVQRVGGTVGAVSVHWATSAGTATPGSDYTESSGDLNWADGDIADKTFTVTVSGDTDIELNETVNLTLSAPTGGAGLGTPNPATLTITNDDVADSDVSLSGGNLQITDASGGNTDDTFTISLNGLNVRINDPSHTINCGEGGTAINANTCEFPLASITSSIQVNTLGGNDSLTLALGGGNFFPPGGVSYVGGDPTTGPGDKLFITGGSQGTVTYHYTNAHDGSVVMSNVGAVTYTGLEPISNTGTAADVIFELPAGPNAATLADDGTVGNTMSRLSGATFETTDFANPTGSLTIKRGNVADTVAVNALPDFNASLTIGSAGNEFSSITFNGAITLAVNKSLAANASGTINLSNGANILTTIGTGTISLTAANVTGAGNVSTGGGLVISNTGSSSTLSGVIAGTGGLTKAGVGTLVISGTNTYTGATAVNAGRLNIGGSIDSNTSVNSGATLGGTGTINSAKTLTVNTDGVVAPGTSPGILNTGSVTFNSSSSLAVEIGGTTPGNAATNHDQLNVTGAVSLGNAVLTLTSFNGFVPAAGQSFVIISNDGTDGVTGTFNGLGEGATIPNFLGSSRNARITYQGGTNSNDVELEVQHNAPSSADNARTILEDNNYTFALADFAFSDPNDTPPDTFINVKITSLPTAGTLFFDADGAGVNPPVAVTLDQLIPVGDISSGHLFFTPAPDANGVPYATFQFAVQDTGGAGSDLSTNYTFTITVTPQNDAPTLTTNAGLSVSTNGLRTIRNTRLKVDDVDNTAAQLVYTIGTAPANGTLRKGAIVLLGGGTFTQDDIDNSLITYQHNGSATTTDSFTFTFSDGIVAPIGPNTFTINICPNATVTNINDSGAGSLRQALLDVCDGGTIIFDTAGTFSTPQTITLSSQLTIGAIVIDDVTIDGPDPATQRVTINGGGTTRLFTIQSGKTATIRDLTITGGSAPVLNNSGGAIYNDHATLTLIGVTVSGNTAGLGGGIYNDGGSGGSATLTIVNSTISGNTANTGDGGGIYNFGTGGSATLSLTNSTLSGNNAQGNGGGIFTEGPGGGAAAVTITNSTITNNRADNDTNSAGIGGGIVILGSSEVTLRNSIVALNFNGGSPSTTADDIRGAVVAGGSSTHNLIGSCLFPCGLTDGVDNNQLNVSAASLNIGPLAANGGIVQTHALLPNSIAIEAGNNTYVVAPPFLNTSPITDERGTGFPRIADSSDVDAIQTVDIGAFELHPSLEDITDQTTNEDTPKNVVFNLGDDTGTLITGAGGSVTATSSNTTLVPNAPANLSVSGSGGSRTLQITPAATQSGTTTITVTVTATNGRTATDTFDLTVTTTNDPPSGTDDTVSTAEGTDYTFTAADFGFTDPNDSPPNTLLAVKVTTLPGLGTLTNNNVPVNAGDFIPIASINSGLLKFTPAVDGNGTPYTTFTFQVQDNGGGTDLDPTPNTMTINVTAVNDGPVNTVPGPQNTNEDTALVFSSGNLNQISVADDAGSNPIKITLTATNGTLTLSTTAGLSFITGDGTDDATIIFTGAVANVNTALNGMSFNPTAEFSGAASLQIVSDDQGNTGTGGPLTDTDSVNITVNALNDPPSGTDNTVSTAEDTAYTFTAADFGFTDPNDTPPNNLLAVKITTLPSLGTLTNNNVPVNAGDSIPVANINGGLLKFTPAADGNGTPYTTFTFQVQDNGGGTDLDPTPNTMTINVTAVNDAPVNTVPGPQNTNEDTALVFSSGNGNQILVADVDAASNAVKITLTATNGTLTLSTTAGLSFITGDGTDDATIIFTGMLTAVNTALNGMSFNPTLDFTGAASLQIVSDDQGNTGTGGPLTDTDSVNITVNEQNDAPVVTTTAGNLSYTENDPATAIDPGLTVTDIDSPDLTGATVAITAGFVSAQDTLAFTNQLGITGNYNSGTGVLTLTGTTTVANYQTALRTVTYQNSSDNPTASRTVSFTVNDGTSNSNTATRGITITAVNDAPVNTVPGPQSTNQNTPLIFSSGNGNQISVADVDAGSADIQVTLTATNGTITLTTTAGLIFSVGDGTADATMTFNGTLTEVNTAMNGMSFTPTMGFSGAASLTIASNDLGNTGTGGPLTDTDVVNIQVATNVSIQDAKVAEPTSGSTNMLFTVVLSAPAGGTVSVNFTTNPGGGNPATAGTDYSTTSGTVTFMAGDQFKIISVPVLSDADNAETDETFLVDLSTPVGVNIVDGQATGTITTANPAGTFLISEIRTTGPAGAGDDFVELYNNSDSPHTVNGTGGGYGLFKMGATCSDTPVLIGVIPNGTVIPARGHFLFVGSAYSLGAYATGDQTLSLDIENDRNVAIFSTASLGSISSANRLDAVGFGANTGGTCDLFREGTTLTPLSGSVLEYSYQRDQCGKLAQSGVFGACPTGGLPKDSNNNAEDFFWADTQGTATPAGQHLGAPGPENLASPLLRNAQLPALLVDATKSAAVAPNRLRDLIQVTNGSQGTLTIRRRIRNDTGVPVTRLRFRIVDLSTLPVSAGIAEMRALDSSDTTAAGVLDSQTCTAEPGSPAPPCTVTIRGTVVETQPAQAIGGATNSTYSVGVITLATPLAAGASVNVQWVLGLQTTGSFKFFVNVEALP